MVKSDRIIAPEEVLRELEKKQDNLHRWAKEHGSQLFRPIDERLQVEVRAILKAYARLLDTRKGRSGADPWVIGLAKVEGCELVTQETNSGSLSKPRIPDVCDELRLEWTDVLGLIRQENWQF